MEAKKRIFKLRNFSGSRKELFSNEFGYSKRFAPKRVPPNVRSIYLLHFEVEGHCEFCDFDVHEGDCCLLPADKVHSFRILNTSTRYWIAFGGDRVKELLTFFGLPADRHARLTVKDPETLFSEIAALFDACMREEDEIEAERFALAALLTALPRLSPAETLEQLPSNDPALRAARYMKKNYPHPLKMADLAGYLLLSEKHLCRLFKQSFGVPPKEYLQKVRMDNAERLLLETDMRVGEVATAVGFASASRFSQVFTARYGISPRDFASKAGAKD